MALTFADRAVRPFTADEVMRMVEIGLVGEDEPVELLEGVLTRVSPKAPEHEVVKRRLLRWLVEADPGGSVEVLVESPLRVPDRYSLPEPDVAIVAGGGDPREHPTTALLVTEVAATSTRTDTATKAGLYAAAGVPEYWVVDVPGRRLLRSTDPRAGRYREADAVAAPAEVQPRFMPVGSLDPGSCSPA